MTRCNVRVIPERGRCHGRGRGMEFFVELDCRHVSEEELRQERYALQNEQDVQDKLRELERRWRRYCCRRYHR